MVKERVQETTFRKCRDSVDFYIKLSMFSGATFMTFGALHASLKFTDFHCSSGVGPDPAPRAGCGDLVLAGSLTSTYKCFLRGEQAIDVVLSTEDDRQDPQY